MRHCRLQGKGAKIIDKTRAKVGRIKHWCRGKNWYGFIRPEGGDEAVFVHHTCMAPGARTKSPKEGGRVRYEVASKKMCGPWTKNVCVMG